MLHAFNQKNVRRVLTTRTREHKIEKNEDAITSMVFSPLAFMTASAALEILTAVIGEPLAKVVEDRKILGHDVQLWPMLGTATIRCEPDLLVRFDFDRSRPVYVIGEMKWDWRVSESHLADQTRRQREALLGDHADAIPVTFVVTKYRIARPLKNAVQMTWVKVHSQANLLAQSVPKSFAGRWGKEVSAFLHTAEQMSFQGFHIDDFPLSQTQRHLFWIPK